MGEQLEIWRKLRQLTVAQAGAHLQIHEHTVTSDVAVYVAVGERNLLAGRLYPHRRHGVESASFVYDDRYLADPDAYALDPALPLVTGMLQTPVGHALFGAFRDCEPDRWGHTLITRAEREREQSSRRRPRVS
jgi:serine/threonine-protein kinase HipA